MLLSSPLVRPHGSPKLPCTSEVAVVTCSLSSSEAAWLGPQVTGAGSGDAGHRWDSPYHGPPTAAACQCRDWTPPGSARGTTPCPYSWCPPPARARLLGALAQVYEGAGQTFGGMSCHSHRPDPPKAMQGHTQWPEPVRSSWGGSLLSAVTAGLGSLGAG